MNRLKSLFLLFFLGIFLEIGAVTGCNSANTQNNPPPNTPIPSSIAFTPVGDTLGANLIDLEELPNGDWIVIGQDGMVYYLRSDFTLLASTGPLSVEFNGEQGLLNIEADPNYTNNHFIYLYFTIPGGSGNEVDRFTVNLSGNTLSLGDRQTIIQFLKNQSPSPGQNHNGGGMAFDDQGSLFLGVGDGGGGASGDQSVTISQDPNNSLGKIHRITPSPGASPNVYALGLRNPFTIHFAGGRLFIGDVGAGEFEEVDVAAQGGINFGWNLCEGPCDPAKPSFVDPLHGYAHDDFTFANEDPNIPKPVQDNGLAIIVGVFYTDSQYGGLLTRRLIYSEFYQGWVRGLQLDDSSQIVDDRHLGHQEGLTAMQVGPDGFIYAVSLFGSERILRVDPVP